MLISESAVNCILKRYLAAALQNTRANLTVHLHSQASKIIFDRNKKAIGVELLSGGQKHVFTARKEVILSAGVFHSPQILQLSGKSQHS